MHVTIFKRHWLLAAVAALSLAGAVGCGSDDEDASGDEGATSSDTASGVEEARSRIEAARGVPAFPDLAPPLDPGPMQGKRVFRISYADAVPYMELVAAGVTQAAEATGASVTHFDAQAQPSEAARGIQRAVSQGYDAVIMDNFSGEELAPAISQATEAGIPVVINNERSGSMPPLNPEVAGTQGFDYASTARLEADWTIQDSDGTANVLVFGAGDVPGSDIMLDAMREEFGELCPDCEATYKEVAVADWADQLPSATSTELNRNQDIEYIIAIWDGMVFNIAPGVRNARASDRVKIVTSNGTPAIMEMLEQGDMVAANISDPMQWLGWAAFDQAMRVLQGEEPIDQQIRSRLLDGANIADIDIDAGVREWYEGAYVDGYQSLWGLDG